MTSLKRLNEIYEMYTSFTEDAPSGKFVFSAKDNLTSKDFESCAGSRILKGYRPPFDATPIRKMREAGGFLQGKTNMDEFGFGTFSANSGFGIPKNPYDLNRSCGGSSGGAACAAAVLEDHVALGVSTGGSIVCPASFCGVYGIAPSYGRVSRYGLIDYANSLDKVGVLSSKAEDLGRYLRIIAGKDEHDPTSCVQPEMPEKDRMAKSVAVPREAVEGISKDVMEHFERSLETLRSMGIDVEYVDMPILKYAMPAYYVIAASEASTNLARFCGMRYGQQDGDLSLGFDAYFTSFRSQYFGDEAKRRILLGTFTRMVGYADRYYNKALRVRESIIKDYKRVFADHDAVVTPTMPFVSPRFDDIANMSALDIYKADFLTIPPNLTGMPHMSVPCGYSDGMPVGLMFTSDHWNEDILLSAAVEWEKGFDRIAPEVKG
ncbi:MAG: amidase family protein [Candidatus Methanomethylophilaceae archaeon]|nr:amidase family protein [Candidatus Methanomethylophilaceae archaeon]MDY5872675.1 amidase family protein [Candidatus Methanomethylophilaceae archaeon]